MLTAYDHHFIYRLLEDSGTQNGTGLLNAVHIDHFRSDLVDALFTDLGHLGVTLLEIGVLFMLNGEGNFLIVNLSALDLHTQVGTAFSIRTS